MGAGNLMKICSASYNTLCADWTRCRRQEKWWEKGQELMAQRQT